MQLPGWLVGRRRRFVRLQGEVQRLVEAREPVAVVSKVLDAERRWGWNWTDGSPGSQAQDAEELLWMARTVATHSHSGEVTQACANVEAVLDECAAFFKDRSNFGLDGRMVQRGSVEKLLKLQDRLAEARKRLRGIALAASNS